VTDSRIVRIERLALVLLGLALLVSLLSRSTRVVLGVATGGGLAALNFFALRRLTLGIVASESRNRQTVLAVLLAAKLGFLAAVLYLVLRFLPVDGLAFLAGISVVVLSILVDGLRGALGGAAASSE
jgi:hypothetical protein